MGKPMAPHVRAAGQAAADALASLERYFAPGRYKLTLVARYVRDDMDADMVVTNDDLRPVEAAVQRRIAADGTVADPGTTREVP